MIAWWKLDNLLMSTAQLAAVGLLDRVLYRPRAHGGIPGQLTLWIDR